MMSLGMADVTVDSSAVLRFFREGSEVMRMSFIQRCCRKRIAVAGVQVKAKSRKNKNP